MEASPGGIFGRIAWYVVLEKCQDEDYEDILHAISVEGDDRL